MFFVITSDYCKCDSVNVMLTKWFPTQFSTTTKLKGKATFVTGAINSEDDADKSVYDALSVSYDLRLGLKTSFTG
jgi:hypothetical protein